MMNYLLLAVAIILLIIAGFSLVSYLKDKRKHTISGRNKRR